ncbi:hypothetical protein BH11MYX1_BH11MYX1_09460 [soil metagenome]
MRYEDKEVDGIDLEHAQAQQREGVVVEGHLEAVPELRPEEVEARQSIALDAMRAILERRHLVINDLGLPQKELRALGALQAAVSGRDGELSQFVFASDRRDLLEQALAVLQPKALDEHSQPYLDLVHRVSSLRHELKELEDAQDNLLEANPEVGVVKADSDTADRPKPPPANLDDDLSLNGPERLIKKPPSELAGPALGDAQRSESTLGSKQDLAEANVPEPQRLTTKPFWKSRA